MKALVTGAGGQLGSAFLRLLGDDAIAMDKNSLDLTDRHAVLNVPEADVIFNCAAYTNVDQAEEDAKAAYAVNCLGVRHLTQLAAKRDIPIVHVSTDYVFDGFASHPYKEDDKPNPQTVYGKTKLLGEQEVLKYPKHFIVRTAWLYDRVGKNFVKTIARIAKEKGSLNVVSDQIGCPTNADDLAEHLLRLYQTKQYGLYHCTGMGQCSWYDFACAIVKILNIPCKVTPCSSDDYKTKASRPHYSVLSNQKIKHVIPYTMLPWEERLEKFLMKELNLF